MTKDEIEVYSTYDGEDITILVRVDYYSVVRPNSRADNPDDYHGYVELDYTVLRVTKIDTETDKDVELDESILDSKDHELIEETIHEAHAGRDY